MDVSGDAIPMRRYDTSYSAGGLDRELDHLFPWDEEHNAPNQPLEAVVARSLLLIAEEIRQLRFAVEELQ